MRQPKDTTEERVQPFVMPLLARHGEGNFFPATVEFPAFCERQANRNHGQTLERLKERGGVSPSEAVAIMLGQDWEAMSADDLRAYFVRFGWGLK